MLKGTLGVFGWVSVMLSMMQAIAAIIAMVITFFITTTIVLIIKLKVVKAARRGRGSREAGRRHQAATMIKMCLTHLRMNFVQCK